MPEVRFKGFSGEWDECKIVDVLNINSGRDYKHLKKGDIPVYGTGGYMHSVNDKLSDDDAIGIGRKGTINKPQLLLAPFWTVDTLFYMTVKGKNDLYFLYSLANRIDWKKYDESTGVPSLSKNSIYKISINVPLLREQTRIGNFFKQLDEAIAIQQQELDTLKQTKQGFLQKMFPKEGESIPEIRFPEFVRDWECYKLGEIVEVTMGHSPKGENYTKNPHDNILVQGNADIKNGWVVPRLWTTQITKVANKGDIILSVRAPVGDVGKTHYDVVIGRGVAAIKGNEFIYQLLLKMKVDDFWKKFSTGSTFESINSTDIKEATIRVPNELEQTKIGNFLKQLDETIALHEQELDILKETKKAFLQKMFV